MKFVVIGTSSGATMEAIMATFRTKENAEDFIRRAPFNLEGLVAE